MGESRTRNSIKNAFISVSAKLLAMLCGFAVRTVFLRYLGAQYTGVSSLFTDILNILSFSELGVGTAISFAFYKPIAEKDEYRIAQLMKLCKYIYIAISCVVLILGLCFLPFLKYLVTDVPEIKESISTIYIMYVVKTAFSYLLIYKSTLVIARQKQYIVSAVDGICNVAKTLLDIILLIVTKDFMVYLVLELVRVVVTNLIISWYADREIGKQHKKVPVDFSDLKKLFTDVKNICVYRISGIVLNSTGSLIVSWVMNVEAVAFLSNYNLIFNSVNNIAFQGLSAITASVGNLAVVKTKKEQKNAFQTINFLCYVFAAVTSTGLCLCTNPFIEILWGKKYVLDYSIVSMLCMNSFIVNMYMAVDIFRTANGVFKKGRFRPLATAAINLIVSFFAVQYLGLFGVLLGTVIARVTTQLWYDPKIVFNTVFEDSAKSYYTKYLSYFGTTFLLCFAGVFLIEALPGIAILRFLIGFAYAIIANLACMLLLYKKSGELNSLSGYVKSLIKR